LRRWLVVGLVWLASPIAAAAIFLCRLAPERFAMTMARPLGALARRGKRNAVLARVDLAKGGEPLTGDAAQEFWRAYLTETGRTIFEAVYLCQLTDASMLARIDVSGEAHLSRALEQGRGAVLFLNHFGNPGTIVAGLGLRGYDLTIASNAMVATIVGEQVELTYLNRVVRRMIERGGAKRALLGDRLPIRLAETLARNGLFGMFIDFPVPRKHNQFLPFGNAHMEINLGPAILALRHRCPVLCVTTVRVGDNRHRAMIHPPIELPPGAEETAAVALLEKALQPLWSDVVAKPEQWWPWDWAEIVPAQPESLEHSSTQGAET
jgi:lauroyl/myristoyl acyltransferase